METERKYYTEAMARIEAEEKDEDKEEIMQMLSKVDECGKQHPPRPNAEKEAWFKALSDRVLGFAGCCDLDVLMRTTDDGYGVIEFRSSYFELSWIDPPEARAFWLYLCGRGELKISLGSKVFIIELWYALFDRK